MIRVLFLAANPAGTSQLALDEEVRAIDAKVRSAEHRDHLELASHWAVRLDDLSGLLMRRPQVVHFSGHGAPAGEVILLGADGSPTPVPPEDLAGLFRLLKDNVRVVVLNACYSEAQAKAIVKHVDCAIGMSREIKDQAAIAFASEFYQALACGRSVQDAFDFGVVRLRGEGIVDAKRLVKMHKRRGLKPSDMVLVGRNPVSKSQSEAVATASPTLTSLTKVFISYSHKDRKFLERFQVFLKPLEREGLVERWDDTRLRIGVQWHDEIKRALASARVAVLLVSADFLASDFIANQELPSLLAAERDRGLIVMVVIVGLCRFSRTPSLAQFQTANNPSRPLAAMSKAEQDAIWVKLIDDIEDSRDRPIARTSREVGAPKSESDDSLPRPQDTAVGVRRGFPLNQQPPGRAPATEGGDSRSEGYPRGKIPRETEARVPVPRVTGGAHKIDGIRKLLASLEERYVVANRQLISTLNESDKVVLRAQLDDLDRQIQDAEAELARLCPE